MRLSRTRRFVAVTAACIGLGGAAVGASCGCIVPGFPNTPTGCTLADASGCVNSQVGTFVTFTNPTQGDSPSFFVNCTSNLLAYAQHASAPGFHPQGTVTGTGWPVHIVINWSGSNTTAVTNEINLTTGCVGQGAGAIDLVLNLGGDGVNNGPTHDTVKVQAGAGCVNGQIVDDPGHTGAVCPGINIAGNVNGGPPASGAHQDCIQYIGGTNVDLYDVRNGDWAGKTWTCRGDGGGLYFNAAAPNGNNGGTCNKATAANCKNFGWPVNIVVQRVISMSCNKGLNAKIVTQGGTNPPVNPQNSSGTIQNSYFRAGQTTGFGAPGACGATTGALSSNGLNYNAGIVSLHSELPNWVIGSSNTVVTNVVGDWWCQTACAWSPGYNPANDSH